MSFIKLRGKNWKERLSYYGINVISTNEEYKQVIQSDSLLFTTKCTKHKNNTDNNIPENFYISPNNLKFYALMKELNLPFGIISDKYGLVLQDEKVAYYDIHPSGVTDLEKAYLAHMTRIKFKKQQIYSALLFYNTSPLLSIPYLEILWITGIKLFYITNLAVLSNNSIMNEVSK